jgi:hypothetical protein
MNGKKAKELRRKYLGDYSVRFRKYGLGKHGERIDLGPHGRYRKAKHGAEGIHAKIQVPPLQKRNYDSSQHSDRNTSENLSRMQKSSS